MKRSVVIVVGAVTIGIVLYFVAKSAKAAPAAAGNMPINALPARAFALPQYSSAGQPPRPTFAPFSGVPFIESALRGSAPATSSSSGPQPSSTDSAAGIDWSSAPDLGWGAGPDYTNTTPGAGGV